MSQLLNIDIISANLKPVLTSKILDRKNFTKDGLYSEQIFGPIKNYTCACKIYHGKAKENSICKVCGVEIINSNIRRKRFAKIELPFEIINPIFYDIISHIGGKKLQDVINELMNNECSLLYKKDNEYYLTINKNVLLENQEYFEGTNAIKILLLDIAEKMILDDYKEWEFIKNNIECLTIKNILVLPPELRPISKNNKRINEQQISDELNRFYVKLLIKKEILDNNTIDLNNNKKLFYNYFKEIQKIVNDLYDYILNKLSKKKGLIRHNILGKRVDFSGRAVITPEPTLDLEHCVLPYIMVLELFKIKIAKKLVEIKQFKLLNNAIDFIDECIDTKNPCLLKICQDITKDEVCLLNRAPSLHRPSFNAFKILVSLDNVLKTHPLDCSGKNSDFDGDSCDCFNAVKINNKLINKIHISELENIGIFKFKEKNKNITKFTPTEKVEINSINPINGEAEYKEIIEYSKHENLKMYKLEDSQNRFEGFWCSSDHSLLIYDEEKEEILKISPEELLRNPNKKYLIQQE